MRTPEGWRKSRLSEIADAIVETCLPTADDDRPYVALEHIAQGEPRLLGHSRANAATSTKVRFRKGDLLFGKLRPNLKKAVLAPFDGVCSTDIIVIRASADSAGSYLQHLAHWPPLQEHAVSTASGTKMPRTSWSLLSGFEIPFPPVAEQKKIAAILSSVDEAIEATQAVVEQLQVVKKAMMGELLTRGIPGRHSRFKKTEIGEVPEGWGIFKGEQLFALAGGYGPSSVVFLPGGPALFLKVDDFNLPTNARGLRDATFRFSRHDNPRIKVYEPGCLVFPKRGAAIFKNRVQVLRTEATVDPNLMVLIPRPQVDPGFLAYSMIHIGLFNLSDNSGIPQINNKHLYPHQFAMPPYEEQQEIRAALEIIDARTEVEEEFLSSTKSLKAALLSVLLTGEVRVREKSAEIR